MIWMKAGDLFANDFDSDGWSLRGTHISNGHTTIDLEGNLVGIEQFSHDKDSKRTISGTASATILGTIALGPLGGIAGALYGGAKNETNCQWPTKVIHFWPIKVIHPEQIFLAI